MASPIVATYSLDFSKFLELAPSLRTQGAKFYTEAEGTSRILKFTKLPLLAQDLLPLSEPLSTDNDDTIIQPTEEITPPVEAVNIVNSEISSSPVEIAEVVETLVAVAEETTTVDVVYLSTEELSKLTKAQLIELATNNNIELPKTVKSRKNLLVEFLVNKIPAAN